MRWVFVIFLCLAGCADRGPISSFNPHTGIAIKGSAAHVRALNPITTIEARVVRLNRGGAARYFIKTFVMRNDRNYPKISSSVSFGRVVPYERDDRHRTGVLRTEAGHIPMTPKQLRSRAETGFAFELSGPRGRYEFQLPARLFRSVLD